MGMDREIQLEESLKRFMEEYDIDTITQEELTEEVNLRLFDKPKHDKINKEMAEFVEGLK
jgi:hypothetical protein